jgi:hypothetical protein
MNPNGPATNPEPKSRLEAPPDADARSPIAADIFCQDCGYELRGLTGERCPECGRSLESLRSPIPLIPWVHRKELGLFRAFWATVRMTMFQRKRLCEEVVRPVAYADAQRFRWMTILHAYVPILAVTLILYGVESRGGHSTGVVGDDLVRAAVLAGWPLAVVNLGSVLLLAAATGVASYFFHPHTIPLQQQNRAVALSYYGCAPLVATVIPAGTLLLIPSTTDPFNTILHVGVAITLQVAVVLVWTFNLMSIARRVIPQRKGRSLLVGYVFPGLLFVLSIACFAGVPLIAFNVYLIYDSLR